MLMLTLGTGVGGAAIINGNLYQGSINRAGHFGHITVDHSGIQTMTNMPGSLEYAIGNFSVNARTHNHYNSTLELVNAYNKGDSLATFWWLTSVQNLSVGMASLINAYSPELIVLGGGITAADDSLFIPLKEFMSVYEWQPGGYQTRIEKAQFGSFSGAVGAAYFAKYKNH
jgi:glucokinase